MEHQHSHAAEEDDDSDDGELGVDYEWVGVYTDAKGIEREVPIIQRKDGVILLTSFNFYSVVNFEIYHPMFILWVVENSDMCDEAERGFSAAVQQLVSPIGGSLVPQATDDKRHALYAQYRVDLNDDEDLRLLKKRGLDSRDFPTLTVVSEVGQSSQKQQVVVGFSGPLTVAGLRDWSQGSSSQNLLDSANKSTLLFEQGIMRI